MQKLHLVGFTADFDGLIFSARKGAKSGSFVIPIDGRLLKQIAEAERLRVGGPVRGEENRLASPRLVRPESSLNPREMQDRIRSGWSVDEVAAEAGVDHDWVRRFAAPVLAEVRRVIERSRDVVYDKPRFGLSSLPLGGSVRRNVLDRGVQLLDEELDDCWSAHQLDEDAWIVRFAYTSRGRLQEAEWLYDIETEELTSRNRLASQLGHVARGRKRPSTPVRSSVPQPSAATRQAARTPAAAPKPAAARKAAPKKAVAKKAVAKKAVAKKAVAKKAVAKKAAPKKAVAKKVAAKRPAPKKVVATKVAARQAAPRRAVAKQAATRRSAAKRAPAKRAVGGKAPAKKAPERPTPRPTPPVVRPAAAAVVAPARNRSAPTSRPTPTPTRTSTP
ncbi:MAG: hypothetical protein JWN67_2450, partial [Actinomycetia bacterium]|nr:hypothetical protein [Actinomycetes bacterium]